MDRIVIVGGGLAGYEAARALRGREFTGEVVMLAAESETPYDRPPLSKDVLNWRDASVHFDLAAVGDIELRLNTPATGIAEGVVHTGGASIECDGIVLAVGADPIPLEGAQTLRTIADAHAIRDQLNMGMNVVVIGAGWIGAEVASAAADAGCVVTVYELADSPLPAALPPDLGKRITAWYDKAGIDLRLGERVDDVTALDADIVVAGLGARPATAMLSETGVELRDGDNAVVVDEYLRTSLPGVTAAGDCAAWWSLRYQERLRVEHWDTALHAPTVAVASLLNCESTPYDPVPYFWSDEFGHTIQFAGRRGDADRRVDRSNGEDWAVGWFEETSAGPLLTCLIVVDRPRDLTQARRLMSAGTPIDPEKFADPSTPVKAAAIR
jgi:3-phenylpropionate/trans-cinnamate dioxygenase ferredoxin reductase subunit